MRYSLFNSLTRTERFSRACRAHGLATKDDLLPLRTFLAKSTKVRDAFEHFDEVIIGNPKGDKHRVKRVADDAALDPTSDSTVDGVTNFGNLVTDAEIEGYLTPLKGLINRAWDTFASRYGWRPT